MKYSLEIKPVRRGGQRFTFDVYVNSSSLPIPLVFRFAMDAEVSEVFVAIQSFCCKSPVAVSSKGELKCRSCETIQWTGASKEFRNYESYVRRPTDFQKGNEGQSRSWQLSYDLDPYNFGHDKRLCEELFDDWLGQIIDPLSAVLISLDIEKMVSSYIDTIERLYILGQTYEKKARELRKYFDTGISISHP